MTTDTGASEIDSVFGGAEDTDRSGPTVQVAPAGGRKRQFSVPEMLQALGDGQGQKRQKKSKRSSKDKDGTGEHSCRLDGESLEAVKMIVEKGIDKVGSWNRNSEVWKGEWKSWKAKCSCRMLKQKR